MRDTPTASHGSAVWLLTRAAEAAKCPPCGCARSTVDAIENAGTVAPEVLAAAARLRAVLVEERYECRGCAVCWPADALNALTESGDVAAAAACPTDTVDSREGWPPLPGAYQVLRWSAPVAVCTLGDAALSEAVASEASEDIAIVGTMATENLGIERLITNTISNPNVRFVILAGAETRQAVGHLPGASLLALAEHGTDVHGRIIDAPGRRPLLRNVNVADVDAFRAAVEVVDLIGEHDPAVVVAAASACAARSPGPSCHSVSAGAVVPTAGYVPARMTPDPAGYFVVYPDRARHVLRVEHYTTDGVLDTVIDGPTPAHCYTAAIDHGLLTRLDHAAYLGRELARAELALDAAQPYIQDAAPEHAPARPACR